jgi:putative nucleotidyltransferase with HDIG domain
MTKKSNLFSIPNLITNVTLIQLSQKVRELEYNQKNICEMAARSILQALDLKDHYTFGHSTRVAYFSQIMGQEVGLTEAELYDLELASLFHDIGKIGTPDNVLNKPDRLSDEEFLIMKEHPVKSAEILAGFSQFQKVAEIAKHHHERIDGRGYPDNLKGEDIPFMSRIILISDTFDAMTSKRVYREGLSHDIAFEELSDFAGAQFDSKLVNKFISGMKKEDKKEDNTFRLKIINGKFEKEAA